ncbi:MAG: hypothetical protein ABI172_04515, partial [Ginsengibacter sp.]
RFFLFKFATKFFSLFSKSNRSDMLVVGAIVAMWISKLHRSDMLVVLMVVLMVVMWFYKAP